MIDRVSRRYGEVEALKEVSFSVERNELFGLIGPDGAGKTSLFRIITTLLLPDTGSVSIDGLDAVKDFKAVRKITGYMPGRFSLYQDLSVEENLDFYATVFGTTVKENYDLVRDIYSHIEPFRKRLAGKLSGGMKQKLALSCALIHRPDFLVLDEPTTGVDAVSRKEFWEMLSGLKNMGITILVSTPYMDEAMLCDRVALIQSGQILQVDTPESIIRNYPGKLYAVNGEKLYSLLRRIREQSGVSKAFMFGQEIHLAFKEEPPSPEAWLEKILPEGSQGVSIRTIDPGIEDCFVELMDQAVEP